MISQAKDRVWRPCFRPVPFHTRCIYAFLEDECKTLGNGEGWVLFGWLVRAAVGRGRTPTLTPGHDPAPQGHAQDPGSSAGTPGINILLQIHPASSTTDP